MMVPVGSGLSCKAGPSVANEAAHEGSRMVESGSATASPFGAGRDGFIGEWCSCSLQFGARAQETFRLHFQ